MKSQRFYNTCIPSSVSSIGIVVNELINSLQIGYGGINECTLFELRVILNEILVNAVRHGNRDDEGKIVKIKAGISERGLMFIIVEDEGCGYDFSDTCNCRKPCCEVTDPLDINENGRGIMIIRSLCDKVKVNSRGNKIIVAKNIARI